MDADTRAIWIAHVRFRAYCRLNGIPDEKRDEHLKSGKGLAGFRSWMEQELVVSDGIAPDTNGCCAMGAVALRREVDVANVDPEDREKVARFFGIADAMAAEIAFENDEAGRQRETPEERWTRMRAWVEAQLASRAPGQGA